MKNRGTLVLLTLFFLGLLGYWWADSIGLPDRGRLRKVEGRVLPELVDLGPDDLRKLVISSYGADDTTLVVERRGPTSWQMTAPVDVAADPALVESLAFTLKGLLRIPEAGIIDEPGRAKEFGFAPPKRTIQLWGNDPSKPLAELEFGITNHNRRFVRRKGSTGIEVVEGRPLEAVDLAPIAWRDRQLVRAATVDVIGLSVTGKGRDVEFRRNGPRWRLFEPFKAPADEQQAEGLVADVTSAKVSDDRAFVADNVKDFKPFGLDPPALVIKLGTLQRDGKGRINEVHIGNPIPLADGSAPKPGEGKVYARRADQDDVLAVDSRVFESIGRTPLVYRSKKLFDYDGARVTTIEVQAANRTLTFGRDNTGWVLLRPSESKVDTKAMNELTKTITDLEASVLLTRQDIPDSGLDNPQIEVRIWTQQNARISKAAIPTGDPVAVLRLGRRDAGKRVVYASTLGDDRTILAIPDKLLDQIPRSPLELRERIVLRLDPAQVATFTIERPGQTFAVRAPLDSSEGNQWRFTSPKPAPADAEAVGRLLAFLSAVPAESMVIDPATDLSRFGLKSPHLVFRWTSRPPNPDSTPKRAAAPPLPRGPEAGAILLGDEVPGRNGARLAMIEGKTLIFTLAGPLVRILEVEFHERTVLSFDLKNLSRVTFRWPGSHVGVIPPDPDRTDSTWEFEGPVVVPPSIDAGRAGDLIKQLSLLQTDRFAILDGPIPADTGIQNGPLRIDIQLKNGAKARVLRLGRSNGQGAYYATNEAGASGAVFLLPESVWAPWVRPLRLGDELPDDVFAR